MKKLFALLIVFAGLFAATETEAQSTSPRFGTLKNQDNTGRVLTYGYKTLTDAAGTDSVSVTLNRFTNYFRVALVDSVMIKSPSVVNSYAGDVAVFIASGASGTKLKFAGTNWVSAATGSFATTTFVLSANGRAIITYVFDGAKWVEKSRTVQ